MGMVMSLSAVPPARLARLEKAVDDLGSVDELVDELIDGLMDDLRGEVDAAEPDGPEELTCYLDKAWHGLSFLLDQADEPVYLEPYMHEAVSTDGSGCVWFPEEVRAAAERLRATPFEQLARHYDPPKMTARDIYPSVIWERDGDEALDYLRSYYHDLVRFLEAAARSGAGVLQTLG